MSMLTVCIVINNSLYVNYCSAFYNNADPTSAIKSSVVKLFGVIVPNIATGIPSTTHILNILLPMTLPMEIPAFPFATDVILMAASGALVPKATMVRPITNCGI